MKPRHKNFAIARILVVIILLGGLLHGSSQTASAMTQIDIHGPDGSAQFGISVSVLPNGNFVVTDPFFGGIGENAGAVYLYDGASGALISMLTGATANDHVGLGGVTVLSNGNYVVSSPNWDNGAVVDAGAVTWGSGTSGVAGAVSALNSLVGSTAGDHIGNMGVIPLSNGNYVVSNPYWVNGAVTEAGAVTWGDGTVGVSGAISAANSLVGSYHNDWLGYRVTPLSNGNYLVNSNNNCLGSVTWGNGTTGISGTVSTTNSLVGNTQCDLVGGTSTFNGLTPLSNGNYVVSSPFWNNGSIAYAGAVTWGNGASGVTGVVSAANSLVGNTIYDKVGCMSGITGSCFKNGVTPLSNGKYVVNSGNWDNGAVVDAGAVTWENGIGGITGVVSTANSLVGTTASDQVGYGGVTALSNGNYVVSSPAWDNGAVVSAGAATWGSGTSGVSGTVSPANSLVGSTDFDLVGNAGVTPMSNGNYVVRSPAWYFDRGAVTWGNGTSGVIGEVSAANSLVGSTYDDMVGEGITSLSNGNYVVKSPSWDNGAIWNAGAVTWGSGTSGVTGAVSATNSLVGSTAGDQVGYSSSGASQGVTPLSNGNYIVTIPSWDNGALVDAGAFAWGNGTGGISGVVSALNSLVGTTAGDQVGFRGVTTLSNGNYMVNSPHWRNSAMTETGAITWGNGTSGVSGELSSANSLVGSSSEDRVGWGIVTELSNSNYVVSSPDWDNGAMTDAGAVTWGNGSSGVSGAISPLNSLVGSSIDDHVGCTVLSSGLCFVNGVIPLINGNYVVNSSYWDKGALVNAGAVTWSFEDSGTVGPITAENSVNSSNGEGIMVVRYDAVNNQLVVGRGMDNIVTLFRMGNLPGAFNKSDPSNGATDVSLTPTLSWGTSSEATSYEYCYDTTNDNSCSVWVSNGTATSKALSGLSANTTYFWQVRAINAGGITYANDGTWWSFTTSTISTPFFIYLPLSTK